jgi:hypothetical protein
MGGLVNRVVNKRMRCMHWVREMRVREEIALDPDMRAKSEPPTSEPKRKQSRIVELTGCEDAT